MDSKPLHVGDEAPDFRLSDPEGDTVHLQALCTLGPVVLLFLRTPA